MILSLLLLAGCSQEKLPDPPSSDDTAAAPDDGDSGDSDSPVDEGDDSGQDTQAGGDDTGDTAPPYEPSWWMDPELYDLLRAILAARGEDLVSIVDQAAEYGDPTLLYNVQLYTNNAAIAARLLQDAEMIGELVTIYGAAYDDLIERDSYLFYYWPGDEYLSEHPLSEPARMWLDATGVEVILESSQFLYPIAYLINAVLELPEEARTEAMVAFVQDFAPVLISDHYERWVFTSTPWQVTGWGCSAGMMNHDDYVRLRIDRELCAGDDAQLSYVNSVHDTDMWVIAGVAEIVAAHQRDPALVPLDDALEADFLAYLARGAALIEGRFVETALEDFEGAAAAGLVFEPGVWVDHGDYAYSGYEGESFPTAGDAGADPDGSWDVSHARRFVQVFDSLSRLGHLTDSDFFDRDFMAALAAQYAYAAFDGDIERPLLNNFMDGGNGWYRVSESSQSGYGPYGLTRALVTGGYGFWGRYNPDVDAVKASMWGILSSAFVLDESGNRRHGGLSGGTWVDGARGGALELDNDGYLDIGAHEVFVREQGSVELWFRSDIVNDEDDLVNLYENGYYDFLLIRRDILNRIMVYIEDEDQYILWMESEATITPDTWHHVVVTQDGSALRIYLDGEDARAEGTNSGAWTGHLSLAGGAVGWGHWNGMVGAVDEVRIYDRALTAEEAGEHFRGSFKDESGLLAWWSFDDAFDTEALEWLVTTYGVDTSPHSSLDLLQFLPTFVVYE
jgi:hypothetical protein